MVENTVSEILLTSHFGNITYSTTKDLYLLSVRSRAQSCLRLGDRSFIFLLRSLPPSPKSLPHHLDMSSETLLFQPKCPWRQRIRPQDVSEKYRVVLARGPFFCLGMSSIILRVDESCLYIFHIDLQLMDQVSPRLLTYYSLHFDPSASSSPTSTQWILLSCTIVTAPDLTVCHVLFKCRDVRQLPFHQLSEIQQIDSPLSKLYRSVWNVAGKPYSEEPCTSSLFNSKWGNSSLDSPRTKPLYSFTNPQTSNDS